MRRFRLKRLFKQSTAVLLSIVTAVSSISDFAYASEIAEDEEPYHYDFDIYGDEYERKMDYAEEYIDPAMYEQAEIPLLRDGWYLNDAGKWNYYIKDAKQFGWVAVDGVWYSLDDNGDMRTGWYQPDKEHYIWYYLNSTGAMERGWVHLSDGWYFLSDDVNDFEGQMKTGWFNAPDGNTYYLGDNGRMQSGYVVSGKLVCYLNEVHDGTFGALANVDVGEWSKSGDNWTHVTNGALNKGWFYSPYSKSYFYLDEVSSLMKTGWVYVNDNWYWLRPEKMTTKDGSNLSVGSMAVGIEFVDGKNYVFNTQPDMPIGSLRKGGWTVVDGKDVYVNEDGTLAVNQWVTKGNQRIYLGDDGYIKSSTTISHKPSSIITTPSGGFPSGGGGSSSSGGGSSWGGSGSSSSKYKQEVVKDRDGNLVYYDRYGNKVQSGWVTDKNGNSYFIENGKVVINSVVTDKNGDKVFVGSDGLPVKDGLVTDNNGDSYFIKDGNILTNQEVSDGNRNTLYVGDDGKVQKDYFYTDKDGNTHYVDKDGNKVTSGIVTDKNGDKYTVEDGNVSKDKVDVSDDGLVTDKDGNIIIFDKDGNKVENGFVQTPNGDTVYVEDGKVVTNQLVEQPDSTEDNKKYWYVGADGKVVYGDIILMLPDGRYIYIDKNGNVYFNGVAVDKDGSIHYLDNGKFVTGNWVYDNNGNALYIGDDGNILKLVIVPGNNAGEYHFVDENGYKVVVDGIYVDKDGNSLIVKNELVVINKWVTIDGKEYHTDENGYIIKDQFIVNKDGSISYVGSDGVKVTDGVIIDADGNKHVIKDGVVLKDQWIDLGDGKDPVYVDKDGNVVTDDIITTVDPETGEENKVVVDGDGHIVTDDGIITLPDGSEVVVEDGKLKQDEIITDDDGNHKFVDENGTIVKGEGVHTDKDGNTVITDKDGNVVDDGWTTIPDGSGDLVHTNPDGTVDKDTWVEATDGSGDKVHVGSDGRVDTDKWIKDENGNDVHVGEDGKVDVDTWVEAPDNSGDKVHVGGDGTLSTDEWVEAPNGSGDKVHVGDDGKIDTDKWLENENGDKVHVGGDGTTDKNEWITDDNGDTVHVGNDGTIDMNTWVDDKYVDEDGHIKTDEWIEKPAGSGNYVHVGSDGSLDKDKWLEDDDGYKIKVDENGNIAKDQIVTDDNGNDVYLDENGHIKENGVIIDDDGKHIIEDGIIVKDKWTTDENGNDIHVNENGVMDTNKVVNGDDGNKHYVGNDGTIVKDQIIELPDGSLVIIDKDGNVVDGGLYEDGTGNTHYVKEDGTLAKDEVITTPNGDTYYADADGNIIKDKWHDGHYYDEYGKLVTNSKLTDENGLTVWVDENGDIIRGGYVDNGDGTKSWVDENGHVVDSGFVNGGNSYVEDGIVVTDKIVTDAVSGYDHYFDIEGILKKDEIIEHNGDKFPIDKDGNIIPNAVVTNKDGTYVTDSDGSIYVGPDIVNVDGNDYYVDTDGKIVKDQLFEDENGKHYVDENGHLVKSDIVEKQEGTYVFDENGNLANNEMVTTKDGTTYYANEAGMTVKGMAVVTDKNGVMHVIDEAGRVVKATDYAGDGFEDYDFATVKPDKYIVDKDGTVLTETVVTDLNLDKWFTSDVGKLVIGQFVEDADGNKYLTGSDGRVVLNKWITTEDGEHTYIGSTGIIGAPHNHESDGTWEQLSEARCAVDGLRVTYCKECGGIVDKEIIPATGHTPEWRTMSAPSCTENGQMSNVCTKCGEIVGYQTLNYLGHDWDDGEVTPATCRAQGYTTYHCKRDGCMIIRTDDYTPLVDHTNSGYKITTAPTCVSVGYEQDVCSECGTVLDTRTVEAKGHVWDMGNTVSATCVTPGYQEHTCIVCGEKMQDGFVDALGHSMSDYMVLSEPTCTSAGFEQSVCDICGYTVYEKQDPLGHDIEENYDYDFLPGYAVKRCETCEGIMERVANTYYVAYDPNSGVGTMDVDTFTYNKSKRLKPNLFNRSFEVQLDPAGGSVETRDVDITSEFTGWAVEEGGGKVYSDQEVLSTLTTVPNETVTLYASWRDVADLPKPSKVGYQFNAWKDINGNIVTGQIICNNGESVTLYADWIPNNDTEYTVKHYKETLTNTWDLVATDNLWGTTGTPVIASTYSYSGFKTPTPKSTVIQADGSTVIEYFYERETYTLYMDKGEGISVVNGAGDYKFGETVKVSAVVQDSTYKWGGWTGNFTPNNTIEATFKMPAYNVNLLANAKGNSYTVEYDNSDCKGRIEPDVFPFDEYRSLSDGSGFKKTFSVNFQSQSDIVYETQKIDLGFLGWTKTQNSSTVDYKGGQSVQNIAPYGTLLLYPVWEKRTITLPTPTKANHVFLGWSTNGQTSGLIRGGSYTPTDDTTLVGLWRKAEYTVKFDGNGANSGSVANQKCTSGDNCKLNSNTFAKYYTITLDANGGNCSSSKLNANLAFQGWSESPNSQVVYANNGNINKSLSDGSEVRLYASWGSGSVNLPAATRTGYTFQGWSESPVAQTGQTGTLSGITSDKRLYAVWSANPVVISYNANGGVGSMSASTFRYGIAQSLSPNTFTKTYKVSLNANGGTCSKNEVSGNADFLGWATSAGGIVVYTNSQYMSVTANTTLYAKWGRVTMSLPNPTKDGYTFAGWSEKSDATSGVFDSYTCESNITLYATWKKEETSGGGGDTGSGYDTTGIPNFTTTPSQTVYLVNGIEIKRLFASCFCKNYYYLADQALSYNQSLDYYSEISIGRKLNAIYDTVYNYIDVKDANYDSWNRKTQAHVYVGSTQTVDAGNPSSTTHRISCGIRVAGKCEGLCALDITGYSIDFEGLWHGIETRISFVVTEAIKNSGVVACNKDSAFMFCGINYLGKLFVSPEYVVDGSGMFAGTSMFGGTLGINEFKNLCYSNYMFAYSNWLDSGNVLSSLNFPKVEYAVGMYMGCSNLATFQGLSYMPKVVDICNINYKTLATTFPTYVFGSINTFTNSGSALKASDISMLKCKANHSYVMLENYFMDHGLTIATTVTN